MEEEGLERRRDSSWQRKGASCREASVLPLPLLTFREQESPPPRQRLVFAKDEAALHHPLRIEILLTPLKVRFTFRSLITFRTCLFFFYIPRPPFNRLASDYDPSPPLPSPLNLSETRRSTIPLLIVVFIFIRKYLNFTGSSSGNYCLSRPPSELPPVSLSLPPYFPLQFIVPEAIFTDPWTPPPATCSTQLEQVHKLSGRTANLGIPSNTVLFISRGIYSSASMSELRRKIEEDSSLEPIASLRDVNCHTINFFLRNDLLSPSLFTRINILASKFFFSFHIRLTNYKTQVSFIYASV